MGYIRGPVSGRGANISTACSRNFFAAYFAGFGLLLALGVVFLAGCGNGNSETPESKKYTSHDAIKLVGEIASESYLEISSTVEGEAAVSVTNGGHLTLNDATIWKIRDDASGSSTDGMTGIIGDQPSEPGGPQPPLPPLPGGGNIPDIGMPEGVLADGPMPAGGPPAIMNPGPGATRAAVYAGSGGTISLSNVSIETATVEGKGLYASGEGSFITLVNGTITTDGNNAHGVLVTHKGTVSVENVTIITKGEYSSALSAFDGNGTVTAVGGTFTAFGKLSAGIYSAGNISATGVVCKSVSDNAAVLDGGSRITLKDSILWARDKGGVKIHKSFSGDDRVGPSKFEMTGGSISADDGPVFYVTNTTGSIYLNQVELYGSSGVLLKALKGEWGVDLDWAKPIQGGTVTFVADNQVLPGDVIVDELSTVIVTLKNGTILTGAINADNRGKNVHLILDASSTWHVTSDSHLTGLTFFDGIPEADNMNIIGNGYTVFYGKDASPVLGGKVFDLPKGGKLMPELP